MKPSDMPHQALHRARTEAEEFWDTWGDAIEDVEQIYKHWGLADTRQDAALLTLATIMATPEGDQ